MGGYLITGGAGFIGSHLIDRLVLTLEKEDKIKVVDNFSTGDLVNIKSNLKKIEICEGDICDLKFMTQVSKGIDFIFHLAAFTGVRESIKDPISAHNVNIIGTSNVLLAAGINKVKKVVYSSSSSVYGDSEERLKQENMTALVPKSPDGATKLVGEVYGDLLSKLYKFQFIKLRYFNVFGPRQKLGKSSAAVIPNFITKLLRGLRPTIYGDGTQARDFTHVDNVVTANLAALLTNNPRNNNKTFNIATGTKISINKLYKIISKKLGVDIPPLHVDCLTGEVLENCADITSAKKDLGYWVVKPFDRGLDDRFGFAGLADNGCNLSRGVL